MNVLINNAVAYADWSEKATTADLEAAHTIFETNVFGAWRTTQILLPLIRKSQHRRIVNVSSGAGSHGEQQFGLTTNHGSVASYGISKAALNALISKFSAELVRCPIRDQQVASFAIESLCPDDYAILFPVLLD